MSSGHRTRFAAAVRLPAVLGAALLVFGLVGTGRGGAYPDRPPPAHTGGFAEPTCHRCHFDAPLDAPGGTLVLEGLPAAYDGPARLRLVLARPGMGAAGFELAARFADGAQAGRQAGRFVVLDARAAVVHDTSGVAYVHHTRAGTGLPVADTAAWVFDWIPPAGGGRVVFHVAANAANDDASEFGDFVYTLRGLTEPAHGAPGGAPEGD